MEMPTAVMGAFSPEFLALPEDALITVMKKHQRYFPVEKNGKLLPHFIAIRNGDRSVLIWCARGTSMCWERASPMPTSSSARM